MSVMAELLALLQPSADWGVLAMKFGEYSAWPGQWKQLAREVILGLIGGIKSRLIDPFRRPPFSTWVRFADPKISDYQRQQVASDLFDADERTLDESSLKIRKVENIVDHDMPICILAREG